MGLMARWNCARYLGKDKVGAKMLNNILQSNSGALTDLGT
jgi:hypothetical protein